MTATLDKRYHTLDGLRGLAAILVALYHVGIWDPALRFVPSGYIAVDYFFALSGFVIAINYEARLRGSMSFALFARTRFVRLYPLYFAGFVLGVAVTLGRIHIGATQMSPGWIAAAMGYGALMLPSIPTPPHQPTLFPFNDPAWSLFVELLVNFLFALLIVRLRSLWLGLLLVATGIALILVVGPPHYLNVGWNWGNFLPGMARATFGFTVGVLFYRAGLAKRRHASWLATIPMVVLAALLVAPRWDSGQALFDLACMLALCPLILVAGICWETPAILRKPMALLGDISYPLYAVHLPLIAVFVATGKKLHLPSEMITLLFLAGSVTVAILLGHFYDVPVRRWASRRFQARRSAEPELL